MKVTFWSNVAVSRNLVELCFKDHEKLGQRIYEMQSMVANIGEVAAKSGNVKVFKWAIWNEYYDDNYWTEEIFQDVAENGHIKILEFSDSRKLLDWYSRAILVDAVARSNWELLDFLLDKKPSQFDLRFTRICIREGFIKVMDWWKSQELIELIKDVSTLGITLYKSNDRYHCHQANDITHPNKSFEASLFLSGKNTFKDSIHYLVVVAIGHAPGKVSVRVLLLLC
jgi:hypothetical protein